MLFSLRGKKTDIDSFTFKAAAAQGLEAEIFEEWQPELDDALEVLPETDIFPHELFRLLMKIPTRKLKRMILIKEGGDPVALAGLKNEFGYWEPVTQWIVPGVIFPVKGNYIGRVLSTLGVEMKITWWRWEAPPPTIRWMRNLSAKPSYAMPTSQNFEDYWRNSKAWEYISLSRTRCPAFELGVNVPGSTEWTIKNWEVKQRPKGVAEKPDLPDRLLVAQYLEKKGLYYTLTLLDNSGKITCAIGCLIHRNDLVAQYIYRGSNYKAQATPPRLFELACYWAREKNFNKFDIGGPLDLFKRTRIRAKEDWAPESGKLWEFDICPSFYKFLGKKTLQLAHRGWGKFNRTLKGFTRH